MEEIREIEYVTETKQRLLANRKARGILPNQVFVKHSLQAFSDIVHTLGAHAGLAYLAALGSHATLTDEERKAGFVIRKSFRDATQLGDRQFRRAVASLVDAGYLRAETGEGRKPRVRLTVKGREAIPGTRRIRYASRQSTEATGEHENEELTD